MIYSPTELAQKTLAWSEHRNNLSDVLRFGCSLDRDIPPIGPGDLVAFVGRPGHAKTSFMLALALQKCYELNGTSDSAVVFVSWEQQIEYLGAQLMSRGLPGATVTDIVWGRADIEALRRASVSSVTLPVWMIGDSLNDGFNSKPPTIDDVYQQIGEAHDKFGVKPKLICLDYLQIVPVNDERDRTHQVAKAAAMAKRLAIRAECPVVTAVQSSRAAEARGDPIPRLADCQWSSAIEQWADRVFSLYMPIRDFPVTQHPTVRLGGQDFNNDPNLLVVKLLKQRFERGYGIWGLNLNPATLEITDIGI